MTPLNFSIDPILTQSHSQKNILYLNIKNE